VELGTGEFCRFPCSQFSFLGGSATLLPAWNADAKAFDREYAPLIREISALEELHSKGEISQDIYIDFHGQYLNDLKGLEERRNTLISTLNERTSRLDAQAKMLQTSLTSVKLHHSAGHVDDNSFQVACDSIKNGLDVILSEKSDIDAKLNELKKISTASITPTFTQKPSETVQSATGEATPILVNVDTTPH